MTIKKLIPCTLTAAVIASAALTGCSSKGTSDKVLQLQRLLHRRQRRLLQSLPRPRIQKQAAAK